MSEPAEPAETFAHWLTWSGADGHCYGSPRSPGPAIVVSARDQLALDAEMRLADLWIESWATPYAKGGS
jgi:hypothetical protein